MRRELRLRDSRRFPQIYREGRGWSNELLVMRALPNGMDTIRFGLVTTRRIGNAVVRNKVRRRLREVLRTTPVKAGWDLVFIARKRGIIPDYHQLKGATYDLLKRAGLLKALSGNEEKRN